MCVVAIALQASKEWPLILIGNRDEFHGRLAAPLARWDDGSGIIAGRDLQSGGTWLGITEEGRLAVITNVRNQNAPDLALQTRGELITAALGEGADYFAKIDGTRYNPFNLMVATGTYLGFATNRATSRSLELPVGIYGVSNGGFDEPWSKVSFLKEGLSAWIAQGNGELSGLFALLADEDKSGHYGGSIPTDLSLVSAQDTPVFIRSPVYGTRCSTVVAVKADGSGIIAERSFDAKARLTGEVGIPFNWGQD